MTAVAIETPVSKICTRCEEDLPFSEFGPSKMGKFGLRADCRTCRRIEYRDYQFERNLLRHYDLTLDQYNEMLDAQNHSCKICLRHKNEFARGLAVDHDHETGVVRGLLCISCNRGIGYLADDIERLQRALAYLMEAGER